jgi:hypothetical protein
MRKSTGRRSGIAAACSVVCITVLLLAACAGDSTEPSSSAAGSYALTSYDSQALPVVLEVIVSNPTTPGGESVRCEDRLAWMSLILDADGRFANPSERRLVCDNGAPDEVTHPAESGSYDLGDENTNLGETQITLTFDQVDGVVTVARGTLSDVSLIITERVTTGESGVITDSTRLEFARVLLDDSRTGA